MPTQTYWINRANQRMDQYILDSERVADEITKAYYKASKRIESQMIKTIQGLSALSDSRTAIKALIQDPDAKALKSLRRAVSALPEGKEKQEALTLLSSPAYQFRLRRLQTTIDNARRECEKLYKVELKDTTRRLRQCYNSAFAHTIYDIDKGFNTLHTFSMFPASRVNTLLRSRWSGKNYSERIWNSTDKLADALKEQLLVSFMTGSGVTEAAAAIREEFQTSAHAARRLVRTETNFIANQSELDAYKRLGIEEYRYIATLDTRTSDICQSLDNQVFKIDDAEAGVNLPPMHPNCRSTTIMHDAEEPLKERIAKDENGKSIYVPGNMSYSQWLQKYHPELVDKSLRSGIIDNSKGIHAIGGSDFFEYTGNFDEKVNPDVQAAFNEEFSRAEKKFGKINVINKIKVYTKNGTAQGEFADEERMLYLRHASERNALAMMERIAQDYGRRGIWSTSHPRHAMRHEIGHAIVLEHKLNDPEWNSKFNSILDVFDKATDPKNKEYVLPSTYADDYVDEFIAECIAASYMKRSKQSETVKKVIEILVGKGVN
ncbi:MAG: minor capsid protein [Oscillospiraceae bacterium]|nr:minor capsid protein [Oscillospiraceae bacterium]